MTYPARVGRPTVDSDIGELFARVRALEASPDIEPAAPPLPAFAIETHLPNPLSSGTDHGVDLSAGVIKTNDGGFVWNVTAPTSPFTGDCFAFDWGASVFNIKIVRAGIFLFRSYFWIISVDGTFPSTTNSFFSMNVKCGPGLDGLANDSPSQDEIVSPGSYFFTEFKTALVRHEVVPASLLPQPFSLSVRHDGIEGNATDAYAGMSIVRLGSLT